MTAEVFMHDVDEAVAVIRFTVDGVELTDTYDLKKVYPGTEQVLNMLGIPFDEAAQQRAIAYVERQMVSMMAGGGFEGDPVPKPVEEVEPPVAAPEPEMGYVQEEPPAPIEQHESLVPMDEEPTPELPMPVVTEDTEDGASNGNDQPEPSELGVGAIPDPEYQSE